jgi:hypothetical protein
MRIPEEDLTAWMGYDPADAVGEPDRETGAVSQTDYARAGAVEDYLGLVAVDGGPGLVLGDEPLMTAWWATAPGEGLLVRWVYAEDQAAVIHYRAHIEEGIWKPSGMTFVVGMHPLPLFDAALSGTETGEHWVIRLDEGRYHVDTGIARPDAQTERLLHRFRRL